MTNTSTTGTTAQAEGLAALVDTYLAAWTEPDPGRRAELVAQAWSDEGILTDPPLTGEGHGGIADAGAALQQQFPGHRFERTSAVDGHHGFLRFSWRLVAPDGAVAVSGLDVGVVSDDGRLARIVGFFGDLPARDGAA